MKRLLLGSGHLSDIQYWTAPLTIDRLRSWEGELWWDPTFRNDKASRHDEMKATMTAGRSNREINPHRTQQQHNCQPHLVL